MGVDIYGKLTNNSAAVFPAKWYPTRGDREKYVDVRVELVGTIDRRTGYPIQNLRASTKGTAVRIAPQVERACLHNLAGLDFCLKTALFLPQLPQSAFRNGY